MGQVLIVVATAVSALAAVSIAVLTLFLVRATNRYVRETAAYVRLVQEQLNLLRAQLAAPLLLEANLLLATPARLVVKCRHSGNASSLPAIIKAIRLELQPPEGEGSTELTDEQSLDEVLRPGRTWAKCVQGRVSAKVAMPPTPSLLRFLFHHGPTHQTMGRLTVILRFQRGGQAEDAETACARVLELNPSEDLPISAAVHKSLLPSFSSRLRQTELPAPGLRTQRSVAYLVVA